MVDRAAHHLFQPLLYQCATGILSEGQIAAPLRGLLKRHDNVDCVLAEVVDIDADAPRRCSPGDQAGHDRAARTTTSSSPPAYASPTSATTSTPAGRPA